MRAMLLMGLVACTKAPPVVATPDATPEGAVLAEVPVHPTYDAATFYEMTTAWGGAFNHDGTKLLITSDASGVFNAVAVATDGSGSVALTTSTTDSRMGLTWFPSDDRFLVSGDVAGNERSHVFVMGPDAEPVDLTPGDETRASFRGWNGDRTAFFVATNERDPQSMDVYVYTLDEGYPRTLLFENTEAWQVGPISPDGRYVALSRPNSNVDDDLFLFDAEAGGEPTHLTPHEGEVSYGLDDFAPDGSALWYTSDAGEEWTAAYRYDLQTGEHTREIEEPWDVW